MTVEIVRRRARLHPDDARAMAQRAEIWPPKPEPAGAVQGVAEPVEATNGPGKKKSGPAAVVPENMATAPAAGASVVAMVTEGISPGLAAYLE